MTHEIRQRESAARIISDQSNEILKLKEERDAALKSIKLLVEALRNIRHHTGIGNYVERISQEALAHAEKLLGCTPKP